MEIKEALKNHKPTDKATTRRHKKITKKKKRKMKEKKPTRLAKAKAREKERSVGNVEKLIISSGVARMEKVKTP